MNADAFRSLYEYHFRENRSLWNTHIMALTQEQFTQPIAYSVGSIRNQVVHMMEVDRAWFGGLSGENAPVLLNPEESVDRGVIRSYGDTVEQHMRSTLANLADDMLLSRPFAPDNEDYQLVLWQVLLQVVNHGTDHRAQILRALHDMAIRTGPQDYIFYAYDHPEP